MSIDITAEKVVHRPRDEVFAYMADPANDPAWIGGLKEVRLVGDPPLVVGSRVERVASFMGRRVEYFNEVIELAPGRVLDMRSVKALFPSGSPTPSTTRTARRACATAFVAAAGVCSRSPHP